VVIRMGAEDLGQTLFELGEGALKVLELAADQLHAQKVTLQDGGFVGQGDGARDVLESVGDEGLAARAVDVIKLLHGGRLGFLDGLQGGPFEQKGGGQRTPKLFAAQFQGLREVLFEQGLQAIGQAGAFIDDPAPMVDQLL